MPTVYQVQNGGRRDKETGAFIPYDVTPAMRYGDVTTLLPESGPDPALAPAPMIQHLKHKLKDFTTDDYLLPMGSPAALCAASIIAQRNAAGPINILIWDRKEQGYYVSRMDI